MRANKNNNVNARRYYAAVGITTLLLMAAYMVHNWGYAVDDSYITFRYAQNARLGYGFVFNVGERFYGSTATGYAVLLAAIAKIGDLIGSHWAVPNISTVLSSAGVGCLVCVFALAVRERLERIRQWLALPVVVVGMVFLVIFKMSSVVSGHETYFYVGLVAVAAYVALFHKRITASVCILFVATTCRPDVALLALMLFIAIAMNGSMRFACVYQRIRKLILPGVLYVTALVGWGAWTRIYYGSFLPETLKAKEAQVKLGVFETFNINSLLSNLNDQFGGGFWVFFLALSATVFAFVVIGWFRSFKSESESHAEGDALSAFVVLTLCYSLALAVAYIMMHVTIWMWYVTPIGVLLLLSGSCASVAALVPNTNVGAYDA